MSALWPVVHRCGHRVHWDLSRKHPEDRAGFARWLALRDCTACWWAKRRRHRRVPAAARPKAFRASLSTWEQAARMPALSGSDKAIAWARKIRHRLVTGAIPPSARTSGSTDETLAAMVGYARTIHAAAWWIDHRKVEPRELPSLLKDTMHRRNPAHGTSR